MDIRIRAVTVTASLFLASAAVAQGVPETSPGKQRSPPIDAPKIDFTTVDTDGDGSLSREEARMVADLAAAFDRLDADHDKTLSQLEYTRWDRAGKVPRAPGDPATAPSGSAGAQHVPKTEK